MDIKTENTSLNFILINDGKLLNENLLYLNLDINFINKLLHEQKIKRIKDILIMTIDKNGNIYLQEKFKPYKTLKKNLELKTQWKD